MRKIVKKTAMKAIAIVIITTLFTSIGQILLKMGVNNLNLEILALATNYPLILGFISYIFGALLLVYAMRYGELSVLYPFIALSFVWVGLMSVIILNEVMTITKWIAIGLIIAGVSTLGIGSQKVREKYG